MRGAELATLPSADSPLAEAQRLVARAAAAQRSWRDRALPERLAVIARFRRRLAADAGALAAGVSVRPPVETLAAEILPLLECCRFLERRARSVLRSARRSGREPLWLRRTFVEVAREPFGVVLIVGPGNYGLMLAGTQALHALAAGNAVIVKPAPGSRPVLERFAALLAASGLPADVLAIAEPSPQTAHALLASVIDKLVFTGSSGAGRELLAVAAKNLVPATLELSGWDACIVLDDADLERAAAALTFAVTLNAGRTCLAPRRIVASPTVCRVLERRVIERLARAAPIPFDAASAARVPALVDDALRKGARLLSGEAQPARAAGPLVLTDVTPRMTIFAAEVFGPVLLFCAASPDQAVAWANLTPFALGVTIFGSEHKARELVPQLAAGLAMINDVIVPAAHPEVTLAARGASGFGATRGPEGLLEMTRPKVVTVTRARRPLHLVAARQQSADMLAAYVQAAYGGGFFSRLRAVAAAFRSFRRERVRGSRL